MGVQSFMLRTCTAPWIGNDRATSDTLWGFKSIVEANVLAEHALTLHLGQL